MGRLIAVAILSFLVGGAAFSLLVAARTVDFDTSLKLSDFVAFLGAVVGVGLTIIGTGIIEDRKRKARVAQARAALREKLEVLHYTVDEIVGGVWPVDGSEPDSALNGRFMIAQFISDARDYLDSLGRAEVRGLIIPAGLRRTGIYIETAGRLLRRLFDRTDKSRVYQEIAAAEGAKDNLIDLKAELENALQNSDSWGELG